MPPANKKIKQSRVNGSKNSIHQSEAEKEAEKWKKELEEEQLKVLELQKKLNDAENLNVTISIKILSKQRENDMFNRELMKLKIRIERSRTSVNNSQKKSKNIVRRYRRVVLKASSVDLMVPEKRRAPRRPFSKLVSSKSKISRFSEVVEAMKKITDEQNIDKFLVPLFKHLNESNGFSFRYKLAPIELFRLKVRFQLSDGFVKGFKQAVAKSTGMDFLPSRESIVAIQRKVNALDFYSVSEDEKNKESSAGAIVKIVDLKQLLETRLTRLAENSRLLFDDGTGEDIVVALVGDKGSDETKICLIIENVETPNNPHSLLVLGFYVGSDTYAEMTRKMSDVFKQFRELSTVQYLSNGQLVNRQVRKKLVGDCKFLSAVYGHSGQSSSFPCYTCYMDLSTHGSRRSVLGNANFDKTYHVRSLDSYKRDAVGGSFGVAINSTPLVDVEPIDCSPPGVHTIGGLFQKYIMNSLVAQANQIDTKGTVLPDTLEQQRKELQKQSKLEKKLDAQLAGFCEAAEEIHKAVEGFEAMEKLGRFKNGFERACQSNYCLANFIRRKKKDTDEWHLCDKCNKDFHSICAMIVTPEEKARLKFRDTRFYCFECENVGLPLRINHARGLKDLILEEKEEVTYELTSLRNRTRELEGTLKTSEGDVRRKLEEILKSIGGDQRTWYQQLTGNQIRNVLRPENVEKLMSIFPKSAKNESLKDAMMNLAHLMSAADNSIKSDEEITMIEQEIRELLLNLKLCHTSSGLIPKLHILAAHLVPFLHKNKNWGRISEQGIENLHSIFNKLNVKYNSVRNKQVKAKLIIQAFSNFNFLYDSGLYDGFT